MKNISIALVAILFLGSCQDFSQLSKNPNLPTTSPPSLILSGVLNSMNDQNAWNGFQGSMCASQYWISSYTYYGTNNYDQGPFLNNNFTYYATLENVVRMETEAKKGSASSAAPYLALGKFFRAYYFHLMSQKFGDLPLTQALKSESNIAPVYDTQKQIYVQVLSWLDSANTSLGKINTNNAKPQTIDKQIISGDAFLANDLIQWQKIVNTFTLRVLVSLSKKSSDTDLNIAQKFANILNNPTQYPILTGNGDNLQYVFNAQFNNYPKNPGNRGQTVAREVVSATYLNLTTSLKDPRTFIAATPAPNQVADKIVKIVSGGTTTATVTTKPAHPFKVGDVVAISNVSVGGYNQTTTIASVPTDSTFTYSVSSGLADVARVEKGVGSSGKLFSDITAYVGGSPGDDMSTLGVNSQAGKYSFVNALRYYSTYDGSKAEPAIIVGYPEMCFNIAEAINRGWVSGSADTWYNKGITASMNFLGITEGGLITVGDILLNPYGTVSTSISNYLAQPSVQYQGNNTTGLNQILTQKYIAFWQNSNWEPFFNQRRTGVPTFLTGSGTGNGGQVPMRWQYPKAEQSANTTNYNAAVQSQYGGPDDLNGKMWILQ